MPEREPIRSLATMNDGEVLVVRHILFEDTRARCAAAGIRVGDAVRCRQAGDSRIEVETPLGTVVSVDRQWGSFVHVAEGPAD